MKKRWLSLFILLTLLALTFITAIAQNLSFQVTQEKVDVYANTDGTVTIEYWITFANDGGAPVIDAVDIGMPNSSYSLSSIQADVNGAAITSIEDSPYVHPGIALNLGAGSIQGGQTGQVHAIIKNVRDMFFKASTQKSEPYASFQFQPNYFDKQYVHGNTDLTLTLILPAGMKAEEPIYITPQGWPGSQAPEAGIDPQGRVYYAWQSANADGSSKYTFGAAFPARLIPADSISSAPKITFNVDNIMPYCFCIGIVVFFGGIIYASIVGNRKRKLQYLPPKIAIEGHGIKRGLTSVEAAILMEQPMDKILTMILFSTVKKNAATVTSRDPLTLTVISPLPDDLQSYEKDFLVAMQKTVKAEQRSGLQNMMINLVKSVTEKMKGFSRKETTAYYQDIIKRAWEQVEAANTPDVKMQKYDEYMGWTMLDKDYGNRTRTVFGQGPVFVPLWWGRYDPGFGSSLAGTAAHIPTGTSGNISMQMPSLPGSDFAASVVNGVQNFSSGVLGDVAAFTGGVTNKTNPIPVSSSSGSSRGGGGCACACACAGCACACAGGGR